MKKYIDTEESRKRNKIIRQKMILRAKAKKENEQLYDVVCKQFGCGKKLSHIENLYSDYCFKCNGNEKKAKAFDLF